MSNRFPYDATRPRETIKTYLVKRIGLYLIRKRQDSEGARLKRPPRFCFLDEERPLKDPRAKNPATIAEAKDERRKELEIINAALEPFPPEQRFIILSGLQGARGCDIAAAFKMSRSTVYAINQRFKEAIKELIENP